MNGLSKICDKSIKCAFVGYTPNGYLCYNPEERKVFASRHNIIVENEIFIKNKTDESTNSIDEDLSTSSNLIILEAFISDLNEIVNYLYLMML